MQDADKRQLLAIMFTDVVGYTALTERDEAAAVRVREQHRDLIQTLVRQFDGEVVDVTGDESLSVFPSALRAVDCAMALQGALRSYTDLRLRIGIHLGDVLRRGAEVVGEGVNVAARVRPLAEPGGIVVSEPVYQLVRTRDHMTAEALGPQTFKNVGQPLPVYSLSARAAGEPARPVRRHRRALVLGAVAAIAVAVAVVSNRAAILAWVAINAPRVLSTPVEQEIGFAETTDGVRVAYATSGAGPPVVLVLGWATHLTEGLGSPLYDQGGAIRAISRDHLLVRYDGRGFGLSDREVNDFSLDARVRDVEAVVDALGLSKFAIMAVSAGGPAAIAYADRHPEKVTHLVLAATFAGRGGSSRSPEEAARQASTREYMRTSWDSPGARAAMAEFLAPEAPEAARRVLMHFLLVSATGKSVAGFMEEGSRIDVSEEARRLRVPSLIVAGSADKTVPLAASRRLASLIPGGRLEILDGADHIQASATDPRLQQMIGEFLATQPVQSPRSE